jgi:hypothetical protein
MKSEEMPREMCVMMTMMMMMMMMITETILKRILHFSVVATK